jgi:hypothetical protein
MANTTCLAAARQAVLARVGWDVAAKGLRGAPRVAVIAGQETHITVYGALRLLGLGDASTTAVALRRPGKDAPGRPARGAGDGQGDSGHCLCSGGQPPGVRVINERWCSIRYATGAPPSMTFGAPPPRSSRPTSAGESSRTAPAFARQKRNHFHLTGLDRPS